jgi:hypothetical protein
MRVFGEALQLRCRVLEEKGRTCHLQFYVVASIGAFVQLSIPLLRTFTRTLLSPLVPS